MQEGDKELLIRYFYGTCTPLEIARVKELLQLPEAGDFFRQLSLNEWEEPVLEDDHLKAAHDNWKKNVHDRILSIEGNAPKKNTSLKWLVPFRYAALWIGIILISGILVWQLQKKEQQAKLQTAIAMIEKTNTQGIPVRYVLPDGSEIFLAVGSTISYPKNFNGKTREVHLAGEAFFEVVHDDAQPFIVHTGDISTVDIGTSFRITALPDRPLEVAVATGKVGVHKEKERLATLTPGNKVTWYQNKAALGQVNVAALLQWKNGDLVFDHLNMKYIAEDMEKRYGIHIVFADTAIKAFPVSGTFAVSKTAAQVMKALAIAGTFRYETSDNKTFTIYKTN
jgi:ferric-dicitrate binding protein FerR (iron transport regulator)